MKKLLMSAVAALAMSSSAQAAYTRIAFTFESDEFSCKTSVSKEAFARGFGPDERNDTSFELDGSGPAIGFGVLAFCYDGPIPDDEGVYVESISAGLFIDDPTQFEVPTAFTGFVLSQPKFGLQALVAGPLVSFSPTTGYSIPYGTFLSEEGFTVTITETPEPAALALLGLGILGVAAIRRRS